MQSFDYKLDPPLDVAADRLADELATLDHERDETIRDLWSGLQMDIDCQREEYTLAQNEGGEPVVCHLTIGATLEIEPEESFRASAVELVRGMARNLGYRLAKEVTR